MSSLLLYTIVILSPDIDQFTCLRSIKVDYFLINKCISRELYNLSELLERLVLPNIILSKNVKSLKNLKYIDNVLMTHENIKSGDVEILKILLGLPKIKRIRYGWFGNYKFCSLELPLISRCSTGLSSINGNSWYASYPKM